MEYQETAIIIIVLFVVGIRFIRYYLLHIKKSDFTSCPNCRKTKPRVRAGKYKCDNCSFKFEVNEKGDSVKNSIWKVVVLIGVGFFCLTKIFHYCFMEESDARKLLREIQSPSEFEKILEPVTISLLCILTLLMFYWGFKGIRKYMKDRE